MGTPTRQQRIKEALDQVMKNPTGKLRGPGGRKLCKWCGVEVKAPRICWCSDECVNRLRAINDPSWIRWRVLERDKGVCVLCGLDCVRLHQRARAFVKRRFAKMDQVSPLARPYYLEYRSRADLIRRRMGFGWQIDRTLWEADHEVPIVEGGAALGLQNIRTLCLWCHKSETAKLAKRRAEARRPPDLFSEVG